MNNDQNIEDYLSDVNQLLHEKKMREIEYQYLKERIHNKFVKRLTTLIIIGMALSIPIYYYFTYS